MTKQVAHLLTSFKPANYNLSLTPNKDRMLFSGNVVITGKKLGRPSQRITFHQKGLTITKATIHHHSKGNTSEIPIDRINNHDKYDEVRLHTTKQLYAGEYTLTLEFKGKISPQMNGMYPCNFKHDGKNKMLIGTQFESHHAREVFPCIDEPAAKATFDLTLTTPKGETVIANTPVKNQKTAKELTTTTFETTPLMSTYLLAFVYGDMGYKEVTTKTGIKLRAYATPDNVQFVDFSLEVGAKILDFYNEYFDIPYPLPKADFIALPDFASGAMENWGCITFREQALLVDPANTSLHSKQYVAMVVAHELAHMWFGNLVTMRWWTDLWLNEGFASWIEYLAVDHIFPEWNMWTQFITDEQQAAFKLDALENTHPIEVPIRHPDEIRTIFDNISYSKGSSVIHMLNSYLGGEVFRDGLRHYLKKHAYGNTDTVDLWDALEHISKKPVKDFMHKWTSQPGYPVVTVMANKEGGIMFAQQRFLSNSKSRDNKLAQSIAAIKAKNGQDAFRDAYGIWSVPLLVNHDLGKELLSDMNTVIQPIPRWLDELISANPEKAKKTEQYLQANSGSAGFYITRYVSGPLFYALTGAIGRRELGPVDRLKVLYDTFELAKADYSDTTAALDLLSFYADEDNNAVWDIIASVVGSIRAVMGDNDNDALRNTMKPYVRTLTAKQLKRLGWEPKTNEPYFDSLLRPTILGLAAGADEPAVVKEAQKRFKDAKKPEDIAPDFRGVVIGTAARLGGKAEFDKMLAWHNASASSEVRLSLCSALTSFEQPELISRALEQIRTDNVRLQDLSYWVAYSFMNRHARSATWEWTKDNWSWLKESVGSDLSFYRFPIYASRGQSNAKFLVEYDTFFKGVMEPALERSYKQGREIIEQQADWKARDYKAVLDSFKNS